LQPLPGSSGNGKEKELILMDINLIEKSFIFL
jgi:hypothetical protein